ncbi:uncharacterized protein EKO05_0004950 [Ascochyta rabiei]|uniref:Uncharacterized protein n=1 Tax=Didymella rabiei TaxID=5454 RepID=A0A163KKQ9_DIDRA|nr:uncharacterized protein EKO05_0004950 [Ascochyta rabiei]KZM27067.1 hypothetical protein ST47_g1856 [Ascochyta rabiei]UPX14470.1 hypothetical protein EKO05_0004950 [Ascochyta rabiei]
MSSAQEVQSLLRFLSQDAKVPLAQALAKAKDLQAAKLVLAADLAKADFSTLKSIFEDDKTARQVLNAAKRVSKKRSLGEASGTGPVPAPSPKKIKPLYGQPFSPSEIEASLVLPAAERNEAALKSKVIFTNRAPLLLAFTVALLKFTMPEQPLSSRLSLAQAVVSMNSKTKAVHIGIDSGKTAEDEGWGEGQPIIRIMNREVRVTKRWGYEWEESSAPAKVKSEASMQGTVKEEDSTQGTLVGDDEPAKAKEPALWGIDLEALKKASSGTSPPKGSSQLPIHTAQGARAYLMKSFETPKAAPTGTETTPVKRAAASLTAEKERNLGMLLGALELLYQSWAQVLSMEDLDRRAWGWYVRTRPEVASGQAGWGGKGTVKLSDILELRRPAD